MNHWKEEPQVHRYWYPIRYLMWHTPHPDTEHLTEDFGIFLEDALMEQVQESPPKGDDIEQVFSDWQRLLPCYDGPSVNGPAISLCTNMHRYTGTAMEYLDFRARLMEDIAELAENDRKIVLGVLRRKLAELLIEGHKEEGGNEHFRRVYRLWDDVQTCIRYGAGEFALFYIRPVADGARLFSPWTLGADSSVEEFYYAAAVSGDLRQSGRAWGLQRPMVFKMRKPLMNRVFRMIKNGIENEDSRALLELYAMLTWTVDGENWDYWELKRFDQLRERYCPPNWGFVMKTRKTRKHPQKAKKQTRSIPRRKCTGPPHGRPPQQGGFYNMDPKQKNIRATVDFAYGLKPEDLVWKPIYPNNILSNNMEGYYTLILRKGTDGKIYGRKYSILFQKEEDPAHLGEGVLSRNAKTELYILFENSYSDVVGPLDYPEPTEHGRPLFDKAEQGNTFRSSGVNDFGRFVWAYLTMDWPRSGRSSNIRLYTAMPCPT